MSEPTYSTPELMATVLARRMDRDDWGACGAFSQIPMAAFRLARATHSPDLTWMSGAGGAINSETDIVDSSSDYRTHHRAEYIMTMEDIVDFELGGWRKSSNFGVFGGLQIDRRGNANMAYIGERDHYELRGPGSVGLVFGTTFHEMFFYLHHHSPDVLCEQVDFVSSPGLTERRFEGTGDHSTGPTFGITPMATMEFDDDGEMYVATIHPGYTPEEVQAATGFEIEITEEETEPPTAYELELLRREIDPHGKLRQMNLG